MSLFRDPVYSLILCILLQGLTTLGNHLTPKVYYLDELCRNESYRNLKVSGGGTFYLSGPNSIYNSSEDGCSVVLESIVRGGYWDIRLADISLLPEDDTLRIIGYSDDVRQIYYDHTDCAQVPNTSTADPQDDSRRTTNNETPGSDNARKAPSAHNNPSGLISPTYDSNPTPYSCDGQLPRILEENIEILVKVAATASAEGVEKANFTIRYNADIDCTTNEFKCTEIPQCVNYFSRCDNVINCIDGTDERNCTDDERCRPGYLPCPGEDHCILPVDRCDGYGDCKDHIDEAGCLSIHFNLSKHPLIIATFFFGIIAIVLVATVISYQLYWQRKLKQIERYRHVQMEDLHEIVNRRDSDVSNHHDHQDDNLELYSI